MSDTKLIVAIGILHLVALGAGGGLLFLAFRGGDGYDHPPHGTGGWGREPPPDPPRGPMGGPPLPSARPARVRLREPARLADRHAPPQRRAPREPSRRKTRPAKPRAT